MVLSGLLGIDGHILLQVQGLRSYLLTEFFTSLTALGSVTFMLVLIGGLWFIDRDDAVLLGTTTFIGGGIAHVLKTLFARARPDTVERLVQHGIGTYSFPSGHATLAFGAAVILAHRRPQLQKYVYVIATLVAISRVYIGVHYATDILAGAVLGSIVGVFVMRYEKQILAYARLIIG